jgi:hypothetical protein
MNEDEILELARAAIAAGEDPDDVAQWLEDAGFDLEKLAARSDAQLRVASGGSPGGDFLHMAAEGATLGQADKVAALGLKGLLKAAMGGSTNPVDMAGSMAGQMMTPAAQARGAAFQQRTDDLQRLAPGASMAAGAAGMVPPLMGAGLGPAASAIRMARGGAGRAARNPFIRRLLPWGGGALLARLIDRD